MSQLIIPRCRCGFPCLLRTSWSAMNPGRRYFRCKNYKDEVRGYCNFFDWIDAPNTSIENEVHSRSSVSSMNNQMKAKIDEEIYEGGLVALGAQEKQKTSYGCCLPCMFCLVFLIGVVIGICIKS